METIRSHFCFEKNPYNVSSNLSLSRAHFSKVHVFCEVVEVVEVVEVMEDVEVMHITYIESLKPLHFINRLGSSVSSMLASQFGGPR